MKRADLVFFGSGVAALVYQTVWARLLARSIGSGTSGTAVVLGVFMGGMAIGAIFGGRVARRTRRPVRLFVGIEIALALWAAASPWLLGFIDPVGGVWARAGVAGLALLAPTVLMGITFPLMGRLVIRRPEDVASETAGFYGANTVGAAAGALAGPFVLMPTLGLTGALYAAALLELGVAALARMWFDDRDGSDPAPPLPSEPARGELLVAEPMVWGAALLGASALAIEVILTRVLITATGASIYAFAIVLSMFLAGIGLGSRLLDASADDTREDHVARFARAALAIPALALVGLVALELRLGESDLFSGLENKMPGGVSVRALWFTHALWAALAVLGPALAFGRALPCAVAAVAASRPSHERERVLGAVYGANTLGALVGALGAGLVLLPAVGPRVALAVALSLAALAGIVCGGLRDVRLLVGAFAAAGVLGVFALVPGKRGVEQLTLAHGPHATVSVEESRPAGDTSPLVRALRVNGKVVATSGAVDLRLQRLLAAIPAILHGAPESALVIGMGTGMTAGTLLAVPSVASLDVVEISEVVPSAGAAPFARWNENLLEDPRTCVIIEDGRHYLARTPDLFDLVTSDPIHPWTAGSSDLYTVDHFREMAEHLAPGGVASQWLPLYQLSEDDVKTVVASWLAAFENASAWLTAYDLVLVGATEPTPESSDERLGAARVLAAGLPSGLAAILDGAGVRSPEDLAALFVADDAALRGWAAGTEPMSDNFPILEFRAPRSFLSGYSVEALRWAGRDAFVESLPEAARPRAREVRGLLEQFLRDLPGGWSQAATAYGESLLDLH